MIDFKLYPFEIPIITKLLTYGTNGSIVLVKQIKVPEVIPLTVRVPLSHDIRLFKRDSRTDDAMMQESDDTQC